MVFSFFYVFSYKTLKIYPQKNNPSGNSDQSAFIMQKK